MFDFVTTNNIDTSKLVLVGCNGSVVNTGTKGGVQL
jgi:hypothetical protein